VGVDVAGGVGPHGQPVRVHRPVVGGPPELVVGGGADLADDAAGDGAAHGGVEVGGEPALGFDGGEVLDLVAGAAAQVLPEPVHQLREVQRVEGGAPVVVGGRVDGDALGGHPPVGGEGEGEEHGGPVGAPVRRGEHPAD